MMFVSILFLSKSIAQANDEFTSHSAPLPETSCDCVRITKAGFDDDDFVPGCSAHRLNIEICNTCDKEFQPFKLTIITPVYFIPSNLNGFILEPLTNLCNDEFICHKKYTKMVTVPPSTKNSDILCINEWIEGTFSLSNIGGCTPAPEATKAGFWINLANDCPFVDSPAAIDCLNDNNTVKVLFLKDISTFVNGAIVNGNSSQYGSIFNSSCNPQKFTSSGKLIISIYVNDDLEISGSATVNKIVCFDRMRFFIAPNKKITVKNAKLNLIDCKITGCKEMWHSIVAEEGGQIITNSNNLTPLIKMEVKDGQYGFKAVQNGLLQINKTTFKDNYISVKQEGKDAIVVVENSSFLGSGNLKPAPIPLDVIPYAGVYTSDATETSIYKSNFENLGNAVIGQNSDITLTGSTINKMKICSYPTSGYGMYSINSNVRDLFASTSSFSSCEKASVYAQLADLEVNLCPINKTPIGISGIGINKFRASGDKFKNADFGIKLWSSKRLDMNIWGNTFEEGTKKGIELRYNSHNKRGIIKANLIDLAGDAGIECFNVGSLGESFSIEENPKITFTNGNAIHLQGMPDFVSIKKNPSILIKNGDSGVKIQGGRKNTVFCNSISTNNSVAGIRNNLSSDFIFSCNTTTSASKGIIFEGICSSPNKFSANTMNGGIGLWLSPTAIIREQKYQGNLWYSSSAENLSDPDASLFTVFTGAPDPDAPYFIPLAVTPLQWFKNLVPAPDEFQNKCKSATCVPKPTVSTEPPTITNHDIFIATDGSYQIPNLPPRKWMEKRELYFRLKDSEGLIPIGQNQISTFITQNNSQTIGRLYEVQRQLRYIFDVPAQEKNDYDNINNQIESNRIQLSNLAIDSNNNPDWLTSYRDIESMIKVLNEQKDSLNNKWEAALGSKIENIINLNSQIPAENIPEYNERTINDIYLRSIAGFDQLSDDDISSITHISLQCPFVGGEAVYRARSMYAFYEEGVLYDDSNCAEGRSSNRLESNNQLNVIVYPNPAENVVNISLPKEYGGNRATVYFVNNLNQLVQKNEVNTKDIIDVSRLTQGVYTCMIYNQSKQLISTQKIVLIK